MPDQTQTAPSPPADPSLSRDIPEAAPTAPPDLSALRAEIDRIDSAMHDLLMQRAALSAQMAASRVKGSSSRFRPAREAMILRRLLARHDSPLPRIVLVRLWRDIITSSLAQQAPLSMAVHGSAEANATRLARGHFGLLTPMKLNPTPSRVLSAVASGEASIGILAAPEEGEAPEAAWWTQMEAPRLQVVAGLPFLAERDSPEPQAFAIALAEPEPSGRDRTLIRLEPEAEHSRARIASAFAAIGLPPRRVLRRELPAPMALVEVEGFVTAEDPRLTSLPFQHIQILGAYAEPEPEEMPA
ncbi:chorismate mutase [Roseomonas marmotae]|uniref:chorismate mutase n=1 Tax=Roseomonas marmotae TaxID=2768161 RepID=A0ABS3K7G3_9PROT|nr:chorismate mutase [Roseomonas marmotae]MBO1073388.1 chorismate mutase [Roseomonas marmotae]QTI80413.1 chorismate mutase [Roseomonas marmotae]